LLDGGLNQRPDHRRDRFVGSAQASSRGDQIL
jgi:hypothetical protein